MRFFRKPQPDAYDQAVEYAAQHVDNPVDRCRMWGWMGSAPGGLLFKMIQDSKGDGPGCLTQIRESSEFDLLTSSEPIVTSIASDTKLPTNADGITPTLLPRFAAWQRAVDQHYGHPAPAMRDDLPLPTRHYTAKLPWKPQRVPLWRRLFGRTAA